MSIVSWIILGLIAGFIGSKIVNREGQGFWLAGNYRRSGRRLSVRLLWRNGRHRSEHLEHDRRGCGLGRGACDLQCAEGTPGVISQEENRACNQ